MVLVKSVALGYVQILEQQVLTVEDKNDDEVAALDRLDLEDLEVLRERRIQQMKRMAERRSRWIALGHGDYTDIPEKEFFTAVMAIKEAALVRLVTNALLGVKSSLIEIDKLSATFLSDPADRTYHRVPTSWCRTLSTHALGKILRDISYSGYLVFLLQEFTKFYLCASQDAKGGTASKVEANDNQDTSKISDDILREVSGKNYEKDTVWMHPPYSLVNQSFAVAVKKVLQGYFGALNTLLSSVKWRRSVKSFDTSSHSCNETGSSSKIVESGITILEIFLHTKELRTHIEVLGNICFPGFADLELSTDNLTTDSSLEFHIFPRGADLLSYLYVRLRDADPVHQALLKFLFMKSWEPYYGFIKSWIYHAEVDDPYEEFFVFASAKSSYVTESTINFLFKERDDAVVPCFLKDFCRPLLRAGQQLEVLVKLLSLPSFTHMGRSSDTRCNWANLEDILPCWVDMSTDCTFPLDSLTFCNKRIETLMHQRQKMYHVMLERLQLFLSKFDARSLRKNHGVIPFGNASDLLGRRVLNIPGLKDSSENLMFCAINDEENDTKINSSEGHIDSSFTSEFSYDEEAWQSSECSSSSEDEVSPEKLCTLHYMSKPQDLLSNISTFYASKKVLSNSIETGKECSQNLRDASFEELGSVRPLIGQKYEDESLNKNSIPPFLGDLRPPDVPTPGDKYCHPHCWPTEGLLRNPFSNINYENLTRQPFIENRSLIGDCKTEALTCAESVSSEVTCPFRYIPDMTKNFDLMGVANGHHSLNMSHSYNANMSYNLNANPVMTKTSWFGEMENSRNTSSIKDHRKFPYFDFSSVSNPSLSYSDNIFPSDNDAHFGASRLHNTEASSTSMNNISSDTYRDRTREELDLKCLSPEDDVKIIHKDFSPCTSGGAAWVGSLKYFGRDTKSTAGDMWQESASEFDIPLDVVIDKCILQEIIIQYKYVSNFTIKLLEEGFDLHEHLYALRRYHFMELGDWADLFIIYLRNQKWSNIEPEKKIAEIQGLLELALKKSSCDTDQYRDRLFVYLKGQNDEAALTCATDVELFDAILLGYRVDWPISIVVTQDALKIYAVIFSYLTQIRLAAFTIKDAWCYLKSLLHHHTCSQDVRLQKMKKFNHLMELRQQIHHFVSALQQYVHSQLSDVYWCRFQHSLKYQVKDMLDLEYVHMSFLTEALHICFLSEETKTVAPIIKNILQCAFEFGNCLTGVDLYVKMDKADASNLQSSINFDQVLTIKSTFEKNIQELYLLFLGSSRHDQLGLSRFWAHLNYNEYYSTVLNKNVGYCYL